MAASFSLKFPVVVRSPNWLGDAIMSLPAVRNLKTLAGSHPVTVAAPAKLAALWEACPFVDRVLPLHQPRTLRATAAALRSGGFAAAVLLPNSLRAAAEAVWAGIPQVIGYSGHFRRWILTSMIEPADFTPARQHQQFYYLDLISALGGPEQTNFPALHPHGVRPALLPDQAPLCLCPGAEYGPAKRWPVERYAETARTLAEKTRAPLLILGAKNDEAVAAQLAAALPDALNLCGKTSLQELMHILAAARLVLSNDSGAMHLASALGAPTVAIFGSTEPRRTGPLGSRTRILRRHVPCSPCFLRGCPLDFACMTQIKPGEVADAATSLLEAK
jgi:heptosyltransferase-2